jgi:hypothetical protein
MGFSNCAGLLEWEHFPRTQWFNIVVGVAFLKVVKEFGWNPTVIEDVDGLVTWSHLLAAIVFAHRLCTVTLWMLNWLRSFSLPAWPITISKTWIGLWVPYCPGVVTPGGEVGRLIPVFCFQERNVGVVSNRFINLWGSWSSSDARLRNNNGIEGDQCGTKTVGIVNQRPREQVCS